MNERISNNENSNYEDNRTMNHPLPAVKMEIQVSFVTTIIDTQCSDLIHNRYYAIIVLCTSIYDLRFSATTEL